ncbi:hypothetical protein BCV70DRAFT_203238 [Testicularia cyperi]|uniref:Ceramide glucosyltransferase n=1 Tax=Testicularia cyperi TaxID=1882483 RepID=A0A317XFE7_9BASI|nr:hypothetical protein BCV70DRAFT_203238 [Testicularia cyperi]
MLRLGVNRIWHLCCSTTRTRYALPRLLIITALATSTHAHSAVAQSDAMANDPAIGTVTTILASACLCWYLAIWSVCLLGYSIARGFSRTHVPRSPLSPPRTSTIFTNNAITPLSSLDSVFHSSHSSTGIHAQSVPGVSVLRPLSGLDCNLYSNLASSFQQDYPKDRFEIILSIRESSSQEAQKVLNVAEMVRKAHPDVNCRIVVGDENAGINPKINNLVRSYALARHDIVWVVDSQVWTPSGAMARAVDDLTTKNRPLPVPSFLHRKARGDRAGLVHHVPFAVLPSSSWGSRIERVFLCTTHAKMYLAINALAIDSCVMGKSNMYRKSDLAQVPDSFFDVGREGCRGEEGAIGSFAFSSKASDPGAGVAAHADPSTTSSTASSPSHGAMEASDALVPMQKEQLRALSRPFARFGIYLAEDNMLALSLWNAPLNLSHTLSSFDLAYTSVGDIRTLGDYTRRRMRWIRVRKFMVLAPTLLEPLTESILSGLMAWYGLSRLVLPLSVQTWTGMALVLLTHFSLWFALDYCIFCALSTADEFLACNPGSTGVDKLSLLEFGAAWLLRETLALPIWMWAICGSTVSWRNKKYRILSSGRAALVPFYDSKRRRGDSQDFDPLLKP